MARVRGASAKHLANHPVVNSQANLEVTTQWKTVDPVINGPQMSGRIFRGGGRGGGVWGVCKGFYTRKWLTELLFEPE